MSCIEETIDIQCKWKVNAKHYTYSSIPPFHKVHSSFILLSRCNIHYSAFSQPKNININNHNKQIMNLLKIVLIGTNSRALPEVDQLWLVCPGGSSLNLGSFKLSEFQLKLERKIYIV